MSYESSILINRGFSPYDGGVFTGPPVLLLLANFNASIPSEMNDTFVFFIFLMADVICAFVLYSMTKGLRSAEPSLLEHNLESTMDQKFHALLPWSHFSLTEHALPDAVMAIYFLNPVFAMQCVLKSGEVLARLFFLVAIYTALSGSYFKSSSFLAFFSVTFDIHGIALVLPLALLVAQYGRKIDLIASVHSTEIKSLFLFVSTFISVGIGLLGLYRYLLGDWQFLYVAFNSQVLQSEPVPDLGLRWYIRQQIFPQFRNYFGIILAAHPFVHVLPLSIRLSCFPHCLVTAIACLFLLFGQPPTLGSLALIPCLMLQNPRTCIRMRHTEIIFAIAIGAASLIFIMSDIWLRAGTGNANFIYFQILALNGAVSMGLLQFVGATMKRRKALVMTEKSIKFQKKVM